MYLQLEDRLTELIYTRLKSTDDRKQWAGLMAVDQSVEQAVRLAKERVMRIHLFARSQVGLQARVSNAVVNADVKLAYPGEEGGFRLDEFLALEIKGLGRVV